MPSRPPSDSLLYPGAENATEEQMQELEQFRITERESKSWSTAREAEQTRFFTGDCADADSDFLKKTVLAKPKPIAEEDEPEGEVDPAEAPRNCYESLYMAIRAGAPFGGTDAIRILSVELRKTLYIGCTDCRNQEGQKRASKGGSEKARLHGEDLVEKFAEGDQKLPPGIE